MNSIEVCLSPALFKYKTITVGYIVVIIDVLRASTSFRVAFDSGVKKAIPVFGLDELLEYKEKGFLTAAELDGKKVDFADFGNSPTIFLQSDLTGEELAYFNTNGTQAVEIAKSSGNITVAAFVNLNSVSEWFLDQEKNVTILYSAWKNTISLENTLCASAIVEILEFSGQFSRICNASAASLPLWQSTKINLLQAVKKANHYQRLIKLCQRIDLQHCFQLNTSDAVPVWDGKGFLN